MSLSEMDEAQIEGLAILAEEAGEVVQVIGKILRHGLYSTNPDTGIQNIEYLEKELADLLLASKLVVKFDLDPILVEENKKNKLQKLKRYVHHNLSQLRSLEGDELP